MWLKIIKLRISIVAAMTVGLVLTLTGCGGGTGGSHTGIVTRVTGILQDDNFIGISNAAIKNSNTGDSTSTDASGFFELVTTSSIEGKIELFVEAATFSGSVAISDIGFATDITVAITKQNDDSLFLTIIETKDTAINADPMFSDPKSEHNIRKSREPESQPKKKKKKNSVVSEESFNEVITQEEVTTTIGGTTSFQVDKKEMPNSSLSNNPEVPNDESTTILGSNNRNQDIEIEETISSSTINSALTGLSL